MLSKTVNALNDIKRNIIFARSIVGEKTQQQFEEDRILFYAATRALEIISEATRRLPKELRERHPHIPWRDITDAGNFYRHEYDNVAARFVWMTITQSLAPLLATIEAELYASSRDV